MTEPSRFLEWDSSFFARRIACVEGNHLDSEKLERIFGWCRQQEIECLYFLCASDDTDSVSLAESAGFHQVDVKVELNCKTEKTELGLTPIIREYEKKDLSKIQNIAYLAYTKTRFGLDRNFDQNRVAELYKEWATESCRNKSHKVFVATDGNDIFGFITCQNENTATIGRIGLLALKEKAQGKGYGQQLVQAAKRHFFLSGMSEVRVVTQAHNIAAQRIYQACGFRTSNVGLWYHKWF